MSDTLFTSDLHFRHKNIIAYTDRKNLFCADPAQEPTADDVERMNEAIIEIWNKQVKPDDTVVHVGDFCFGGFEVTKGFIRRLNGKKRFVLGNHDDRKHWGKIAAESDLGIDRIYFGDGAQMNVEDRRIILSHFPYYVWDKFGHGTWNLCGHSHGSAPDAPKKQLDVGIDNKYKLTGKFELWTFEEIREILDQKHNHAVDHHTDKTNYA